MNAAPPTANRPALIRAMARATWNEAKANDLTFEELLAVCIDLQRQIAIHSEIPVLLLTERIIKKLNPTLNFKP